MELVSEGAATPKYEVPPIFTDRRVLAIGFVAVCVIAGYLVVAADGIGWFALSVSAIVAAVFIFALIVDLRRALLFAFVFSFVQPILTRLLFNYDFPFADKWSMIGYKDPLTTLVSLMFIVSVALALPYHLRNGFMRIPKPLLLILLAYSGINFVQIFNPNMGIIASVYGFKNNLLPALMLFVGSYVVQSRKNKDQLLKGIVLFSIVALIYGLYQDIVGLPAFDEYWYTRTLPSGNSMFMYLLGTVEIRDPGQATAVNIRVPSLFAYYGYYSYVITAFGLLVFAGRDYLTGKLWRYLRVVTLMLLFLYYAISMERTAIVMFIAGVGVYYYTVSKHNRRTFRFIAAGAISLVLLVVVVSRSQDFLKNRGISAGNAKLVRLAEIANPFSAATVTSGRVRGGWAHSVEVIRKHPIMGTGTGSASTNRGRTAKETSQWVPPLNAFLHKQIELGFAGLVLFVMLLYCLYRGLAKKVSEVDTTSGYDHFAAGMIGVLAAYILCGMFNVPFLYQPGIVFWFLAGAAISRVEDSPVRLSPQTVPDNSQQTN